MSFKVSIVGAGGTVGAMAGYNIAIEDFADEVVYVDIAEDKAVGQAHDTMHGIAYDSNTDVHYGEYEDAEGSDVVVITAGKPREPGMSRLDLADANKPIMEDIVSNVEEYAPEAITVLTTNPMDVLNYHIYDVGSRPREKVIGFAGRLDSARFRYVLSEEFDTAVTNVDATIIGEHGDTQVPVFSKVRVDGTEPEFDADERDEITEALTQSAMNVIEKKGATQFGPGRGVAHVVESIAKDAGDVIPSSVVLDGEYGHDDVSIGVPAKIGRGGVEEVVEWDLDDREQDMFDESAEKLYDHQH
ncbi:MAG: malate dehydrogenase [Halobacteria archaeon]|nr:malate dehydrogenase [Halobacteria archaeon]